MKVVVLGSTGMLGHTVGKYLINNTDFKVKTSYRNEEYKYGDSFHFDPHFISHDNFRILKDADYVINCIGKIKPHMKADMIESIDINSIFPRVLADLCCKADTKLIHITTDCVFSGKTGCSTEETLHDCEDDYGKTKSLGEPDNCMVLRTSIIGEELHDHVSLIAWIKKQAGKETNGYTNHYWNGITTNQYARICEQIMSTGLYEENIFHIYSDLAISKYELIDFVNKVYNLDIKINPIDVDVVVDRTLSSVKSLNDQLYIPSIYEQIQQMKFDIEAFTAVK